MHDELCWLVGSLVLPTTTGDELSLFFVFRRKPLRHFPTQVRKSYLVFRCRRRPDRWKNFSYSRKRSLESERGISNPRRKVRGEKILSRSGRIISRGKTKRGFFSLLRPSSIRSRGKKEGEKRETLVGLFGPWNVIRA